MKRDKNESDNPRGACSAQHANEQPRKSRKLHSCRCVDIQDTGAVSPEAEAPCCVEGALLGAMVGPEPGVPNLARTPSHYPRLWQISNTELSFNMKVAGPPLTFCLLSEAVVEPEVK